MLKPEQRLILATVIITHIFVCTYITFCSNPSLTTLLLRKFVFMILIFDEIDTLLNWRMSFTQTWRILISKIWLIQFHANTQNRRILKQAWFWTR